MFNRFFLILLTGCAVLFAQRVTFELHVLSTSAAHGQGTFAAADIDGDGKTDIVNGHSPNTMNWRSWDAPETAYAIETGGGNPGCEIQAADMDGDGDADAIAGSSNGNAPCWWENPRPGGDPKAGAWTRHGSMTTSEMHDLDVCDIDNNGMMDVTNRNKSNTLNILFQTDTGWKKATLGMDDTEGTGYGDIDGDGDLDMTDGTSWYETPSNAASGGSWTKHPIGSFSCNLRRVCLADLNKDDRLDVMVSPAEYQSCPLLVYLCPEDPKTGTWQQVQVWPAKDNNFHTLEAFDMDLDGNVDIVTGATHGPNDGSVTKRMFIFFNENGEGTQWHDTSWVTPKGVWQAQVADIGSDGDYDILNCDYGAGIGQYEYWENTLDPPPVGIRHQSPRSSGSGSAVLKNGRLVNLSGQAVAVDLRGRLIQRGLSVEGSRPVSGLVIVANMETGRIGTVLAGVSGAALSAAR